MFFRQYFPLSVASVPLTIPCYICQCVQAQIPLDNQLCSGQPVPALFNFFHIALLHLQYANRFPESLTCSYLQFGPGVFARYRQYFSLIADAWIGQLHFLTLNYRLATALPSHSSAALALVPTSAPVHTASTSTYVPITPSPSC